MISESVTGYTSDGNDGNESDTTILVWKDDEFKKSYNKCTKAKPKRTKKRKNVSTPLQVSFNFEVSVHGICHRRCKYSLICKV